MKNLRVGVQVFSAQTTMSVAVVFAKTQSVKFLILLQKFWDVLYTKIAMLAFSVTKRMYALLKKECSTRVNKISTAKTTWLVSFQNACPMVLWTTSRQAITILPVRVGFKLTFNAFPPPKSVTKLAPTIFAVPSKTRVTTSPTPKSFPIRSFKTANVDWILMATLSAQSSTAQPTLDCCKMCQHDWAIKAIPA